MAKLAVLQYLFVIDPDIGWTSGYDFENLLKNALSEKQLKGEVINADGNSGLRVIHIYTNDQMDLVNNLNKPRGKK